jgi:hypothetical protein
MKKLILAGAPDVHGGGAGTRVRPSPGSRTPFGNRSDSSVSSTGNSGNRRGMPGIVNRTGRSSGSLRTRPGSRRIRDEDRNRL